MADEKSYMGFDNTGIINLENNKVGIDMLDKLSRIANGRRIQPLDQFDNIVYPHRYTYDNYTLIIGDTFFIIPPEFIAVTSESMHQSIVTLRQENTQKIKPGYHKRTIMIDLVFNGTEQLNGYKVDGPEVNGNSGYYYVDGLRQLLAQFKCTPFLPISNGLINNTYAIFTVALQSITIQTMPGFPDAMIAHITLQEVNMFPYLQMPDAAFKYMIDWDLFRFYYQRLLTEEHEYKKLQSLPANKEHNKFKISILDESIFDNEEATKYNLLQIICDKKIVKKKNDGVTLDDTNYEAFIDSDIDNVNISSFQCNYSNILTNIQLSDASSPTVQFMGGMDTIYNITFETTDYSIIQALEKCQISNDLITRNNKKFCSLGFVKLESELVEFTGSLFVIVDSVTTNTVPGFPNLYNAQIQCVAYDIAQSEREELHGFKPFYCNKFGNCGKYVSDEGYVSDHIHDEQAIDQSMTGLFTKIKQDVYAENKIRNSIEVYPDLHLPTYNEVDEVITKIRKFRKNKQSDNPQLSQLEYSKYPKSPTCMLHGISLSNTISFDFANESKSIIDSSSIKNSANEYDIFVDPDFYVFYPTSYSSFLDENENCYDSYSPKTRDSVTTQKNSNQYYNYHGYNSSLIERFISTAKSFVGCKYKSGTAGEPGQVDENGKKMFDCSGLVTYCLKAIGVMPMDQPRFGVVAISKSDLFVEVPWDEMQRGDVLCSHDLEHTVIYQGKNDDGVHMIIEAANEKAGVREHVLYFESYYGQKGRCFRPKAFIMESASDAGGEVADITINSTSKEVWAILKSYGLSDIAAAAILGNAYAESGVNSSNLQGSFEKGGENDLGQIPGHKDEFNSDQKYTKAVDNGTYSWIDTANNKRSFYNDSAGYGLFQFTDPTLKKQLLEAARYRGVSISNVQVQVDCMIVEINNTGVFNEINACSSIQDATTIFLKKYENPTDQSSSVVAKRTKYARAFYRAYNGTVPNADMLLTEHTLTQGEFDTICRAIMSTLEGKVTDEERPKAEKALAQVIYDRLNYSNKEVFGGLSNILNGGANIFPSGHQGALNDTIEKSVKAVFCENDKYWPDYQALYFLSGGETSIKEYNDRYYNLGDIGSYTFWGSDKKGSTVKYSIVAGFTTGPVSKNDITTSISIEHQAFLISSIKKFGQPVFVKTDAIVYSNTWKIWGEGERQIAREELNSTENIFNTSFCDEVQYSGRGKLIRAFPTYLFCILDDQAQWYDGRKLWTNYYIYKSVVDIAVHSTNDMPIETATITVTNSYHNLDRMQGGLSSYKLSEDEAYGKFRQKFYDWTGVMLGFGPKLTDKLIKLHQVIYNQALLREGARIHIRMGYGSDPLSLAPVMNGHVSDVSLGDQITIVAVSDGNELIQHLVSAKNKEKDTNNGFLGLFGFGESQESSNIIADVMCKRSSWVTHLAGDTFEASKYGIEHFGLYLNKTLISTEKYTDSNSNNDLNETYNKIIQEIKESGVAEEVTIDEAKILQIIVNAGITDEVLSQKILESIVADIEAYQLEVEQNPDSSGNESSKESEETTEKNNSIFSLEFWERLLTNVLSAMTGHSVQAEQGTVSSAVQTPTNLSFGGGGLGDLISDIWDAHQENYDLLKNVYKGNYQRQHYIYTTAEFFGQYNEANVVFNKFNMTPWDVFQICTQQVPEYIVKPSYHQFDSRLYFGLPLWMEKYRYDILNGVVYEECKTAAQVHFIDSMDCIIDNQVKVTSKFSNTNVKVMYVLGSEVKTTEVIHSDDSIDNSKQKTEIIDSPIVQDVLGPDVLIDAIGYSLGADSARRIGISNLLYGWQQQYQGQLLLMGHPGLKPHDYIMLNDTFANLNGLCIAREVTHSFNAFTGFTTSVVPGMIGFNTDENSGLIQTSQNYLMLLSCFSSYTYVRKHLRDNYERNAMFIAELETMQNKLKFAMNKLSNLVDEQNSTENISTGTNIVFGIGDVIGVATIGVDGFRIFKNLMNLRKETKLSEEFLKGYNAIKNVEKLEDIADAFKAADKVVDVAKNVDNVVDAAKTAKRAQGAIKTAFAVIKGGKNVITTIKTATITGGTLLGGVPGLFAAVFWIMADIFLDKVFTWLSNRNVCTLLPLWWEGYPFVSGVKDGEKILLTESIAVGTDENNQADGIPRNNTDEE